MKLITSYSYSHFCLNDTMRYFLCPGKTDMHKGMSSLCGVIQERMGHNIKHGDVFIFICSDKKHKRNHPKKYPL